MCPPPADAEPRFRIPQALLAGPGQAPSPFVHYVPGQISCLVYAEGARTPSGRFEPEGLAAIYAELATCLDRQCRALAAAPADFGGDAFAQDLDPGLLRFLDAQASPLIAALDPGGSAAWAAFERSPRHALLLHGLFRVGPEGLGAQAALQATREAVNLLNINLGALNADLAAALPDYQTVALLAVAPNWLLAGAPVPHTAAGPGVPPIPAAEPAPGAWHFQIPALAGLAAAPAIEKRLVVAVLDTCPPRAQVAAKAVATQNPLLSEIAASVVFHEGGPGDPLPALPLNPGLALAARSVNWHEPAGQAAAPDAAFAIPDHGVFAAGIIRSIAPGAKLHLVPVLDAMGLGDVAGLIWTLGRLRQALAPDSARRLIVNLSLVVDMPPGEDDLIRVLFPRTALDAATLAARRETIRPLLPYAAEPLAQVLAAMSDAGVLFVAAAGNDAHEGLPVRPLPRQPAALRDVMGVGATGAGTTRPARFSNRADTLAINDGIATFGGDSGPVDADRPPRIDGSRQPPDAILGAYSADFFPPIGAAAPQANAQGWAWWSGTSFATAVATGVAVKAWAALWAAKPPHEPVPSPNAVIHLMRVLSAQPAPWALEAPAIPAKQVLHG